MLKSNSNETVQPANDVCTCNGVTLRPSFFILACRKKPKLYAKRVEPLSKVGFYLRFAVASTRKRRFRKPKTEVFENDDVMIGSS